MSDQNVQHGNQPQKNAEVQHGKQPQAEATVEVQPNGGIVADFQGGDPVPPAEGSQGGTQDDQVTEDTGADTDDDTDAGSADDDSEDSAGGPITTGQLGS